MVGAARGLGRAAVGVFAEAGYRISVLDALTPLPEDRLVGRAGWYQADLRDLAMLDAYVDEILSAGGLLDALLFFQRHRGEDDPWKGEMEVSLDATRHLTESLAHQFGHGGGAVVYTGSVADRQVAAEQPVGYHVAKAGLAAMARYYAVTLGPLGISCNVVAPSIFRKGEGREQEAKDRLYAPHVPLGRLVTDREIARIILFLASPEARFLTGQTLVVDGGLSLHAPATLIQKRSSP
jgi:NAD(P)-dependent dehydrogenase (short-subunit alcohol dehydrogenase family)